MLFTKRDRDTGAIFAGMATPPQKEIIPALTGVRAIAIGMVALHHHGPWVPAFQFPAAMAVIEQAYTGVAVFFVLSGFLIAHRYMEMPLSAFWPYLLRRIGRILPLYALLSLVTFLVFWLQNDVAWSELWSALILNLTLLKGWFPQYWSSGILQGWSLTVEMTFYLLAPVFFLSIRKWRWWILVFPILLLAVATGAVLFIDPDGSAFPFSFVFGITFFGRCTEFFLGVALALWLERTARIRKGMALTSSGAVIGAIALAGAAHWEVGFEGLSGILLINFLFPIGVVVLLAGLIKERTALSAILASKPLVFFGRTSYAFYLVHLGVFFTAAFAFTNNLFATMVILELVAWLLYAKVEQPCYLFVREKTKVVSQG